MIITTHFFYEGINYALTREAKDAAEKYNNAIKRITAFTKRKAALSKNMKSCQVIKLQNHLTILSLVGTPNIRGVTMVVGVVVEVVVVWW